MGCKNQFVAFALLIVSNNALFARGGGVIASSLSPPFADQSVSLTAWTKRSDTTGSKLEKSFETIKRQMTECPESYENCAELEPQSAAFNVQGLLKLSESERSILLAELLRTADDPILALKINPRWVDQNEVGASTDVLDAIATFRMAHGNRRDEQCPGFLYHFKTSLELGQCKVLLLRNYPNAFAVSPATIALIGPAAAGLDVNREPLAFSAVIHKVGVRQDDVEQFEFFYT
jgi:hypothetical protein